MEVPENTMPTFDLVLMQPIQAFTSHDFEHNLMDKPLHTRCTFEWNGKNYKDGDNFYREYVLTKIN